MSARHRVRALHGDPLRLLDAHRKRPLKREEARSLEEACRQTLLAYRAAARGSTAGRGDLSSELAQRALLFLSGAPGLSTGSLKDYDAERFGPFLGVSDDGQAAAAICEAALESPKARALPPKRRTPGRIGVAVDAERLAGVGELAVGPMEYAAVWLEAIERTLITTNIGTRVNVRLYGRPPLVRVESSTPATIREVQKAIAEAFSPFINTPDNKPRPLTVYVEFPRRAKIPQRRQREILSDLRQFVTSGGAAQRKTVPDGQRLGLAVAVRAGPRGRDQLLRGIQLAASAKIDIISVQGVKRRLAEDSVSLAGLLDYFAPGLVGPILRAAAAHGIEIRAANLPDTDTIARSIWVGLATARRMGANLGKYGCFPLTRPEIDHVVGQVQHWFADWSAAPVFFVDQGLISEQGVDVDRDLPRGIRRWLSTVAKHRVRIVLIDTLQKAAGRKLLRANAKDRMGYLGLQQMVALDTHARRSGIRVLWAGGLGLKDVYALGQRGVFGVYVTSAAATLIPVEGSYARDPLLSRMKRPTKPGVARTKLLLEAGFLATRAAPDAARDIDSSAQILLNALEATDDAAVKRITPRLSAQCEAAWRAYWRKFERR